MITEHHNSAQIAAEVAARYGVSIAPNATVIVAPVGYMATAVDYVWTGNALEGKTSKDRKSWREMINRQVSAAEKARRREEASQRGKTPEGLAKLAKINALRQEQVAEKANALRAIAHGMTSQQIAAYLGVSTKAARKYLHRHKIEYIRVHPSSKVAA